MENVVMTYLNTGAGHLAGAKALSRHLETQGFRTTLLDGLPVDSRFFRSAVEGGYRFSTQECPWLWALTYELNKVTLIQEAALNILRPVIKPWLRKNLIKEGITRVVNFHFLLTPFLLEIKEEDSAPWTMVTLVTDPYSVHPFWFRRKEAELLVFSDEVRSAAKDAGHPINRIHRIDLPVSKVYETPLSQKDMEDYKKSQGFSSERPLVLLAGGGDGLRGAHLYLKELVNRDLKADIAVVCGRNQGLFKKCTRIAASLKNDHHGPQIKVYGFVDGLHSLMCSADVVLSKAGASTFTELLHLKKPQVVVQRIYGQEQGNVDFLLKHQVGFFAPDPQEASSLVKKLLDEPEKRHAMGQRITQLGLKNGTEDLGSWITSQPIPQIPFRIINVQTTGATIVPDTQAV